MKDKILEELAIRFHKEIEGEYGCPGASCPGVQRLILAMKGLIGVGIRLSKSTCEGQ